MLLPARPAHCGRACKRCAASSRLRREQLSHLEALADTLKEVILPVGIALSVENDFDRLLERIVLEAKSICHADGGTLYLRTPDDRLKFAIMITTSLNVAMGTRAEREIPFAPLALYDPMTGAPNHRNIATHVALEGRSVNIPNIYEVEEFDFSATRLFDSQNYYRSISTLTVPLKNNDNEVIGVLQLLNAQEPSTGEVVGFDQNYQLLVELLAAQAAVAVNNQILQRRQADLLRIERDLQIGREIQAGFLPVVLPQPDGWEIAARFDPAREVAGDFYDAFSVARNRVGLVIADVCDKELARRSLWR
jgi:sigma-B regulation protein RsbU (phosphoserine phosphatase)